MIFFGYLASGFVLLAGIQLAWGSPAVLGREQTLTDSLFLLLAAYVVGQVVASIAKAIWEDAIVGRILQKPSINLLKPGRPRIRGLIFPGYYNLQIPLWADMRTATREHMEIAFQQRRRAIVGDCRQLKNDVDSYNDNFNSAEAIQISLDFTEDMAEAEAIPSLS